MTSSQGSGSSMGNLEKLGILVIVILVVVVGVVAITPKSTVDDRLYPEEAKPLEPIAAEPSAQEPAAPGADGLAPPAQPGSPAAKAEQGPWPLDVPKVDPLAATPPAPAPVEPGFKTVKVQKGDTLATIARRELGAASRYPEILDVNPGLDPRKLKIGQDIKIPVRSAASPGGTAAGPEPAPVQAGGERVYVVKSGDTLSAIARRELGSANKWGELLRANEDVLHGSTSLKIGMKLRIPVTTGATPPAPSADGALASRDPAAPTPPAPVPSAGERTYTVQPGDSLALIAKREMGSESYVTELRAANGDVLKGSDRLQVGTVLKIPAAR